MSTATPYAVERVHTSALRPGDIVRSHPESDWTAVHTLQPEAGAHRINSGHVVHDGQGYIERRVAVPTTVAVLARDLDVPRADIEAIVDQLVDISGYDAVIAGHEPIVNGSGRVVAHDAYLTADAEAVIREQLATEQGQASLRDREAEARAEDDATVPELVARIKAHTLRWTIR